MGGAITEIQAFLERVGAEAVKKIIGSWSRQTNLRGAGAGKPKNESREPEPIKEIYKNGSQEPEARPFLEEDGAESWKPVYKGTGSPTLVRTIFILRYFLFVFFHNELKDYRIIGYYENKDLKVEFSRNYMVHRYFFSNFVYQKALIQIFFHISFSHKKKHL